MPAPQPEKRRHPRIRKKVAVAVKTVNGHAEKITGETRDVSERGVFMYVGQRLPEGSEIEVVLPIPRSNDPNDDVWVRCRARVLRVEADDHGRFGVAAILESYERVDEDGKYPM